MSKRGFAQKLETLSVTTVTWQPERPVGLKPRPFNALEPHSFSGPSFIPLASDLRMTYVRGSLGWRSHSLIQLLTIHGTWSSSIVFDANKSLPFSLIATKNPPGNVIVCLEKSKTDEILYFTLHTNIGPMLLSLWYRRPISETDTIFRFRDTYSRLAENHVGAICLGDYRGLQRA